MAAMTSGAKLALLNTDEKTHAQRFTFTRKTTIVAIVVTVSQLGVVAGGLLVPSIDDLELKFEGADFRPTRDQTNNDDSDSFVDARSLTLPLRYLGITMPGKPDITCMARWKNFIAGTPIYEHCLVNVTFLYNFADEG
jgi:hypothetical protein